MQRLGFIHDMLDVKVLILFVTARSNYPMTVQEIYEVCYQDDCLSYFDICTAIPEMVTSGHLKALEEEKFEITEKGRETGSLTEDSIAFTVKQRVIPRENGDFSVLMSLDDEFGNLMTLELVAPDQRQAVRLSRLFEKKAENVYNLTMMELLDDEDSEED